MAQQVSFDATPSDRAVIRLIADRAERYAKANKIKGIEKLSTTMDLTAVHLNGCPLRLSELLSSPDFTFVHDIFGIRRHLDRDTGKLINGFLPYCARSQD